jgi:cytoskeletal protein RodZ
MGIWAESAKTLKYNNSMLRGKTLFKTLNENSRYNSLRSKIDPKKMDFGLDLVQKRKNRRALIFFILIYPLLLLFLSLWIVDLI